MTRPYAPAEAEPESGRFDPDALFNVLTGLLGDRVSRGEDELRRHASGEGYLPAAPPDLVVYPASTEEVSAIARACAAHRAPMVPFGAGTSLEGHVSALAGGVSIDLTRMNRVLRVDAADLDATVEAGVTRLQLAHALRSSGVQFTVDPGADATIGGMIATGASGTQSVRYGTMRENVRGLTVVLADGQVIRTGGRARKSSAGYDLTRLFVGSEGTLGIITEACVRLHPVPDAVGCAIRPFARLEDAVAAVVPLLQSGVDLARIELADRRTVRELNAFAGLALPESPALLLELHCESAASLAAQMDLVDSALSDLGVTSEVSPPWATTTDERARLWDARHRALYASLAARPGTRAWATDACVPLSALARCITESREDLATSGLSASLVGHVGDGNFHFLLLVDTGDRAELTRVQDFVSRLAARAIAMGGTCTGEHGVGYGKIRSLELEHGGAVHVMRAVKAALDPLGLLNPGKLFAPARTSEPADEFPPTRIAHA